MDCHIGAALGHAKATRGTTRWPHHKKHMVGDKDRHMFMIVCVCSYACGRQACMDAPIATPHLGSCWRSPGTGVTVAAACVGLPRNERWRSTGRLSARQWRERREESDRSMRLYLPYVVHVDIQVEGVCVSVEQLEAHICSSLKHSRNSLAPARCQNFKHLK